MENNDNTNEIINLINKLVDDANRRCPRLISDKKRALAIEKFSNSNISLENVEKIVTEILSELEKKYIKRQNEMMNIAFNPNELNTHLNSKNQGVFISSLMIQVLALVNCSDINEINNWLDSVPNLYMVPKFDGEYSDEEIENIKTELFDKYQQSLICSDVANKIKGTNYEDLLRYSLHKKLAGLNISIADELKIGNIGLIDGLPALYNEIKKICINKFGTEKGTEIYNKICAYLPIDFENFNSSTYEQMKAFNEKIKSRINDCKEHDGSYQLVIDSVGYNNSVFISLDDDGNKAVNYDNTPSEVGQNLAEDLGCSYRLRSIINRIACEEMVEKGYTKDDKEIVIQLLRESLCESLTDFNENIKDISMPKTYELFNELVEIKKADKNYNIVWEEYFDISLEDLVNEVIKPNEGLIKDLKEKNVEFMYNETLLQESPEKQEKVLETINKLQELSPAIVTIFGDQDHTYSGDYTDESFESIKSVAEFDKKVAGLTFKDENGNDFNMKIECTERDLNYTKEQLDEFKQNGTSKEEILKDKQLLLDKHNQAYADVPFERVCEWTVLDNISGEYFNKKIDCNQDTYMGSLTSISDLAKTDMNQTIENDMNKFTSWKQEVAESQRNNDLNQIFQDTSSNNVQSKQISQTDQMDKPKVMVLTNNSSNNNSSSNNDGDNNGYISSINILLIIGLIIGSLFITLYLFLE